MASVYLTASTEEIWQSLVVAGVAGARHAVTAAPAFAPRYRRMAFADPSGAAADPASCDASVPFGVVGHVNPTQGDTALEERDTASCRQIFAELTVS